jgi:hypothetical protein
VATPVDATADLCARACIVKRNGPEIYLLTLLNASRTKT